MRIEGTHRFDAPIEAVFDAIHDPATLLAVIPGCEDVQRISDTEYRGRIALRLPGVAGRFEATVRVLDAVRPDHSRIAGRVDGAGGSVEGEARFDLHGDANETRLDYTGSAVIGGPLGRLDTRFAEGVARSLIDRGLGRLETELRTRQAETTPVAAASEGPGSRP